MRSMIEPNLSREKKFEAKKAVVLREAARAFRSRGYHRTTLDDVAQALNVTKPALYYYFESKQAILFECHRFSLSLGDKALKEAMAVAGSGRAKLARFLTLYIQLMSSKLGNLSILSEVDSLTGSYRDEVLRGRRDFDHRFRALIAAAAKDGSVREVDPKLTVFFFMGAVQNLTRWYDPEGTLTGSEIADVFVDLLVEGLRPRVGERKPKNPSA